MSAPFRLKKRGPAPRRRRQRVHRRPLVAIVLLAMLMMGLGSSIAQYSPTLLTSVGRFFWDAKSEAMELLLVLVAVVFKRKI